MSKSMETDDLQKLNAAMQSESTNSNTHIFLLIFKQGCPPCMAIHPTWMDVQKQTSNIFALDQQNIKMSHLAIQSYPISGYPTMLHLHTVNDLWEADAYTGDRDAISLNKWINSFTSGGKKRKTIKRKHVLHRGRNQTRNCKRFLKKKTRNCKQFSKKNKIRKNKQFRVRNRTSKYKRARLS